MWMELEFADVTDKGSECFFFRGFSLSSFITACRTGRGFYLICPCIHLYVKPEVVFLRVTDIWGLLQVNPAELRVVANHREKKKKRKRFPS